MSSSSLPVPFSALESGYAGCAEPTLDDIRDQFVERPTVRAGAIRGAVTGIVLGAGLWGVIIAGVVRVLKH